MTKAGAAAKAVLPMNRGQRAPQAQVMRFLFESTTNAGSRWREFERNLTMKKTLVIALAAASTLAVAAPAMAQPGYYGGGYNGYNNNQRYEDRYDRDNRMDASDRLQRRLDNAIRSRRLSPQEARALTTQVRDIERLERRYWADGRFDGRERADIQRRVQYVESRLRMEERDRDGRYGNSYGYNNGYNSYDNGYGYRR